VLRGTIGAVLLMRVTGTRSLLVLVPLGGLLAWASVAIGRRTMAQRGGRRWVAGVNAAIVFAGLVLAVDVRDQWSYGDSSVSSSYNSPGSGLTNLHLYDMDGKPLTDVQVFDQWGNPVDLGGQPQPWYQPDGGSVGNVFPRPAYRGEWQPSATEPPIASVPPSPADVPLPPGASPSTTPATPASPSVSPTPSPSPTR
jgi:hypothetical protein